MYKIKTICEDFVVDEIPLFQLDSLKQDSGKFIYLKLNKKNRNTVDAVRELSWVLGVSNSDINFAGTKDKFAITSQFFSVKFKGKNLKELFPLNLPEGIIAEFLGFGDNPLSLGFLNGNKFKIVLRNLECDEKIGKRKLFVNYFDEQRFSKNNVEIGKAIILKDFKAAVTLIDDFKVKEQLAICKTDYLKALLCLPKKILMLYLHAYQSYLWNETTSRFLLKRGGSDQRILKYSQGKLVIADDCVLQDLMGIQIPLIGALPLENSVPVEIREIVEELLLEEEINRFDFIIKQLPNLTPEGSMRSLVSEILDLKISERVVDEFNEGFEKQVVEFVLGKGSYATMVIKFLVQMK